MTTSRRGFLGMVMGAVAAAAIGIRLAPETPKIEESSETGYTSYLCGKDAIINAGPNGSDFKSVSYNVRFAVGLPPDSTSRMRIVQSMETA
jgi:hypothetical protein